MLRAEDGARGLNFLTPEIHQMAETDARLSDLRHNQLWRNHLPDLLES